MSFLERIKHKSTSSKNKSDSPAVKNAKEILDNGFKSIKKEQLSLDDTTFPPGGAKLLISRIISNASIVLEKEGKTIEKDIPKLAQEVNELNREITIKTLEVAGKLTSTTDQDELLNLIRKSISAVQDIDLPTEPEIQELLDKVFFFFVNNIEFPVAVTRYLDEQYDYLNKHAADIKSLELENLIRTSKIFESYVHQYPQLLTNSFCQSFEKCFGLCNELYTQIHSKKFNDQKAIHQNWIEYMSSIENSVDQGAPLSQEAYNQIESIYEFINNTAPNNTEAIKDLILSYNKLRAKLDSI